MEPFDAIKHKALMDGLECREIQLSETKQNKDFRIDSAFYTTRTNINPSLTYGKIGSYLLDSQYGVSIDMNETGNGYPIYRMNEIHNMLCDIDTAKYAVLTPEEFAKVRLNDRDVLFNRTNSYEWVGRTGVYYKGNTPHTFASYLVRLVPDDTVILPEYLTAYLCSKSGIAEIRRRARESINQTNVNPEEVREILIPLLDNKLQQSIRDCFTVAHTKRLAARALYDRAERVLSAFLGLSNESILVSVATETLSISYNVSKRLDAEYYLPKYRDIERQLATTDTVQSLCNFYDKNYIPHKDEQYMYIELSNVGTTGSISDVEVKLGSELPSRARRLVKAGQIIVSSIEGSLRSCALITSEYDGALCSTGFYVVDSDTINSESLFVLFKSEAIQALLKQRCSGTILTAISKDEFKRMPLPKIDCDVQKQIAKSIQESLVLRNQSEQFLEAARHTVEIAIEQGEEAATMWLNERTAQLGG